MKAFLTLFPREFTIERFEGELSRFKR